MATISITESDLFTALRTFLIGILPAGIEVIKSQDNGVGEPVGTDFVAMTMIGLTRLSTNVDGYTDPGANPGTRDSKASWEARIQLDVHGPASADNSAIIATLFRDEYACISLGASNPEIQPLYCDDPRQMPFINGENQYEQRWLVDARVAYNPITQTPQDFFDQVEVDIINVDAAYPPGA